LLHLKNTSDSAYNSKLSNGNKHDAENGGLVTSGRNQEL